jgi:hypothetical protein
MQMLQEVLGLGTAAKNIRQTTIAKVNVGFSTSLRIKKL